MGKPSKYPPELVSEFLAFLDQNPGATKEELAPIVAPYFEKTFDAEEAKRAHFSRYFSGLLRRVKTTENHRKIRMFYEKNEQGKLVNAHAILTTVDDVQIIEKQILAIDKQIGSLLVERAQAKRYLDHLRATGKPIERLVDGEFLENASS
ncbi:hypothetical protein [Sulfoacidibacillus thermotolerans]|uniref:Uncharacterized protein n=1 Tax=Sulfoacidibacillus thermotolerans TaxID=1765684 RepID=A0A2U3D5N1_SULT2|nr:hypothetical protein [Sulfoacidibacillus thermotolerans]PWI56583.1 hypothetical protein BM613_12985 [Sulfoacidibacillus thermotolerans]